MGHIRSNQKKNFFNSAANGLTELLKSQVSAKPELLNITNQRGRNTEKLAIFYALKNHHIDTTVFLNKKGQKINENDIIKIIFKSKSPIREYIFFTELSKLVTIEFKTDFNNWLFNTIKFKCYELNHIDSLEKLLELNGIKPNWNEIITEYRTYKNIGNINNPTTLQFVRDITLRFLLDDI